jgi:hypothetical protein
VTEGKNRKYNIHRTATVLAFRTASFSDETASVLHSGIYNREFASVLASLAFAGLVYLLLETHFEKTVLFNIVFVAVFVGGFPFFRTFVFREKYMETVFDTTAGKAEIFMTGIMRRKKESIALSDIGQVLIESRKQKIENPDGVEFVEKISLQHGVAIPGFGEETVRYLLKLKLADGTYRTIYADKDMQDVMEAHGEIIAFLNM